MGFLFAIAVSKESPKPSISLDPVVAAFVTDNVPMGVATVTGIGAGLVAVVLVVATAAAAAIPAAATEDVNTVVGMASPAAAFTSPEEALPLIDVIISSKALDESHDFTVTFFPSSASSLLRLFKTDTPGLYRIGRVR